MKTGMRILCCCFLVVSFSGSAMATLISETNITPFVWPNVGTAVATSGPVSAYPSDVDVAVPSGEIICGDASGTHSTVKVTVLDGSHTWSDDLEVALRAPDGTIIELWNDAGGSDDIAGDVTFVSGAVPINDANFAGSGTYGVSVYDLGVNNPAATATGIGAYAGLDPNGTWSLYVWDDSDGDTGQFAGGWMLELESGDAFDPACFVPEPEAGLLLICSILGSAWYRYSWGEGDQFGMGT